MGARLNLLHSAETMNEEIGPYGFVSNTRIVGLALIGGRIKHNSLHITSIGYKCSPTPSWLGGVFYTPQNPAVFPSLFQNMHIVHMAHIVIAICASPQPNSPGMYRPTEEVDIKISSPYIPHSLST